MTLEGSDRSALGSSGITMQPIYDWFHDFYERTGINLTFIYDDFDRARMISGFFLTIERAVITVIVSIMVVFAGAFNIEIFRSGIEAIPKATVEAATSFGLSRWQTYRLVVLPMAIRVCLPALGNNLVNLVKTTNLAYAIAVPELLYVSKQIWSGATNVREMMFFVLIAYLCLVFALVAILNGIERRLAIPGFGQQGGH